MDCDERNSYGIYKAPTYKYLLVLALPGSTKWKLCYIISTNKQDGYRWTN